MNENVEKCPMCGYPKGENCDLMVGKGEKTLICCCQRLQRKTVKKA